MGEGSRHGPIRPRMHLHGHGSARLTRFSVQAELAGEVARGFNIAHFSRSRGEDPIHAQNPTLKMTSTKIELSWRNITRLADLSDLAEMLFPGNRNQQHAFLVVWIALKWRHDLVPNLANTARRHGVSIRTLERVRAKMRRMGLIDHVSRFNGRHGYRDGWVCSSRFERSLRQLADRISRLRDPRRGSQEKEAFLIQLAAARLPSQYLAHSHSIINRGDSDEDTT